MTSMIQNYVNNIKNNNITVPQNKTQDALRTHVRAYRPTGYIIDENPYSLKSAFHSDMRSIKYFADGIRGRGNDYSIGKINDVAIKLGGLGIGSWVAPRGGYFISFDSMPGCAKKIVGMCKEAGVTLTGAGATYPYGKDPKDSNIRIAPSFPSADEMKQAAEIFALCVKLVTVNHLLAE